MTRSAAAAGPEQHFKAAWQCPSIHPLQASPQAGASAQQAHSACPAAQQAQAGQLWAATGGESADDPAG